MVNVRSSSSPSSRATIVTSRQWLWSCPAGQFGRIEFPALRRHEMDVAHSVAVYVVVVVFGAGCAWYAHHDPPPAHLIVALVSRQRPGQPEPVAGALAFPDDHHRRRDLDRSSACDPGVRSRLGALGFDRRRHRAQQCCRQGEREGPCGAAAVAGTGREGRSPGARRHHASSSDPGEIRAPSSFSGSNYFRMKPSQPRPFLALPELGDSAAVFSMEAVKATFAVDGGESVEGLRLSGSARVRAENPRVGGKGLDARWLAGSTKEERLWR